MTTKLDFCCKCNDWLGANAGTMRIGHDGEIEIICGTCKAIEDGAAVPISHRQRILDAAFDTEVTGPKR